MRGLGGEGARENSRVCGAGPAGSSTLVRSGLSHGKMGDFNPRRLAQSRFGKATE